MTPFTQPHPPHPLSWPCMSKRMRGWRHHAAAGADIQLGNRPQGQSGSRLCQKERRGSGDPRRCLDLGITGHKFPPGLTVVTKWAGLVILSILNHWYQHMSGKGCFMSRVIHVQSELAAWICVIAVAFTHSLQLPRCSNHAGSLSRFRARYCLCFRVFLCQYVNISAPWICLPYGWVNQDPGPLCYNMQSYTQAKCQCFYMWSNHFSLLGFWILRYAFSL